VYICIKLCWSLLVIYTDSVLSLLSFDLYTLSTWLCIYIQVLDHKGLHYGLTLAYTETIKSFISSRTECSSKDCLVVVVNGERTF